MKDIGIKPTKLLSELNFGQIWVRTGRLKLEGKMSPNSEKLTKIDFKMMLECCGRLQMKVLGIISWYLLKKWKKNQNLSPGWHSEVGPNFVIMDFRGKTRSDILQGQALFRGVKQPRRCLVMLNNF